jgi:hypothetical protein
MTELGPEIPITDGKKPEWLADDEIVATYHSDDRRWYGELGGDTADHWFEGSWRHITAIRVRADHPIYQSGTRPMNATVTDAHRQKCADLATAAGNISFDVRDAITGGFPSLTAFAQYVANTEAREQSILSAITGPGSDADKLAAVRAIVEPVDPFVDRARRIVALLNQDESPWFAEQVLAGKEDGCDEMRVALHILREGAGK